MNRARLPSVPADAGLMPPSLALAQHPATPVHNLLGWGHSHNLIQQRLHSSRAGVSDRGLILAVSLLGANLSVVRRGAGLFKGDVWGNASLDSSFAASDFSLDDQSREFAGLTFDAIFDTLNPLLTHACTGITECNKKEVNEYVTA